MTQVAIIGGGIGGLTAALMLAEVGIDVTVYEAAPEIHPLGVGINLMPYAAWELLELGLGPDLEDASIQPEATRFFNHHGQLIHIEQCGVRAGFSAPQFSLSRASLQKILLQAVIDRLGDDRLKLGRRCTALRQAPDRVFVEFDVMGTSAATKEVRDHAIVIGCDGIHSVVRSALWPNHHGLHHHGVMLWRGVTPDYTLLDGKSMVLMGLPEVGKLVAYPIKLQAPSKTTIAVNWLAEIRSTEAEDRDWNRSASIDDFAYVYDRWRFDWLDVPALLRGADRVFKFPMVDMDPLPHWTLGRVTLLGDAAHPMVPLGSNGSGQAILDARELSRCLSAFGCTVEALQHYEAKRRSATRDIILADRMGGRDQITREVHRRTGGLPFKTITEVLSADEIEEQRGAYARTINGSARA